MLPIRTRHRLTLATLTILAIAAALSVVVAQPSTARPRAVETLALEPTLGTIPPAEWRLWLLPVTGGEGDTE